jgi:cytosine/adenosine deaminase-related metal-dependent hydrolase
MIIGPCTIVTGGSKPAVIDEAGVRITGAHVAQLGPVGNLAAAYPEETLWPARGRVLMPGFVNTHAHLARHLARGLRLTTPAEWRRYEQALSPEDVRWAVTAALVEGVRHGVTTVGDFHRSGACIDLSLSEVLDAARAVGVRVATCYGASEFDTPAERRAAAEECVGTASDIAKQREGGLRGLVGIQATSLEGVESLMHEALEVAGDRLAVHVDLALDSTPAERRRSKRRWHDTVLPSLWAHAESAPKSLLLEARERGDFLSAVQPSSFAGLARDVEIAWGSDAGLNAPPLPEAISGWAAGTRVESHYQRVFVHGPNWAARLFSAGLGEITAGAPADLVLLDYRPATELSSRTLYEHFWAGLLRAPVSGVMVAGEVLLDNGVIVSVDEREVAARARECAKRVWERLDG